VNWLAHSQSFAQATPAPIVTAQQISPAPTQFIGAWYGKWDGIFDAVLTVTSVGPDGIANIDYRWRDRPNQDFTVLPTKLAKIQNGVLAFGSISLRIDAANPNQAMGELNGHNENGPVHRLSVFAKR